MNNSAMREFTEKDLLHDLLTLEKDIVKTYGSFIVEVCCEHLRAYLMTTLKTGRMTSLTVLIA